jgi:hypothetical protein
VEKEWYKDWAVGYTVKLWFDLQKEQIFSLPSKCPTGCGAHTDFYFLSNGAFSLGVM